MVDHPFEYPWSNYRYNALGQNNPVITPHNEYQKLGVSTEERQSAYRALFKARISERTLAKY